MTTSAMYGTSSTGACIANACHVGYHERDDEVAALQEQLANTQAELVTTQGDLAASQQQVQM
jgi:hypothetical protein